MDGKYSKYIENFMERYTTKDGKVEITTSANGQDAPLIYKATPEIIKRCNTRLDEEYVILDSKKDEIKADMAKTRRKFIYGIGLSALALGLIMGFLPTIISSMPAFITTIGGILLGGSSLGMVAGEITLAIEQICFERDMNMVNYYRNKRQNIETLVETDPNITSNLSQEAKALLASKQNLRKKIGTSEVFDMDFVDKLLEAKPNGKKDLEHLLKMYKAVLIMTSNPVYRSPKKEQEAKIRVKKPESK